jgi:hypothetical protein
VVSYEFKTVVGAETYRRYRVATTTLFGSPGAMQPTVWDNCEPDAQINMALQLEEAVERDRVQKANLATKNLTWGAF